MPRTIGFLGSVAFLVSNITGPSLVVIPLLFQQAGWLTPVLAFAIISLLTGAAALFLVEAMSSVEGNEGFQASVEFTTIAHLFLGRMWHIIVQGLLYLAMQSLVIASLLEAFQGMDAFLINVAHKTCAVSFTEGWICVNHIPSSAPGAFSGFILGSLGTSITLSLILPLSLVRLVDNIIFQVVSFILLIVITITWIVIFAVKGLDVSSVPVIGHNQSTVVGFVLSNFAFVMTTPAWVNNTHPSVNIRLALWTAILIACFVYIPIGWMGGSAFVFQPSSNLLEVLVTNTGHGILSTVAQVSTYMYPLAALITSIPVYMIVIRQNLLRGNICSDKMAIFLSAILPWLIVIPLQTNGSLSIIINWASLIFASPSNLLVPFVLFIASKRHLASTRLNAIIPGDLEMSLSQLGRTLEKAPVWLRADTDATLVVPDCTTKVKMKASEESRDIILVTKCISTLSSLCDVHSYGNNNLSLADTDCPELYIAFPFLASFPSIQSTYVSAVGFLVAVVLILIAFVYCIMYSVVGPGR